MTFVTIDPAMSRKTIERSDVSIRARRGCEKYGAFDSSQQCYLDGARLALWHISQ
jgi:hypothetical protein